MKLRIWGLAALAAMFMAGRGAPLRAERQESMQPPAELVPYADDGQADSSMELSEDESYQAWDECDTCQGSCTCGNAGPFGVREASGSCCVVSGPKDMLSGMTNRPVQIVAGAEYIHAQATFSEALSFIEIQPGVGDIRHQFDFDYESSFSVYGGAYVPDCGGSVIFEYTQLNSSADFTQQSSDNILFPFEVGIFTTREVQGFADVESNTYDLSFAKTIPLGCLQTGKECGECCDDLCCSDGCCPPPCPAWDITWSGGVRYGDVDWINGASAIDATTGLAAQTTFTTLDFEGFGGRVGLLGRRYIGKQGRFSVYGKGDWSLLFGDVDIITTFATGTGPGALATTTRMSNDITVPVTEIELGGSVHLGSRATLSAGYFWAAWHDLGMSPTPGFVDATPLPGDPPGGVPRGRFEVEHYDDANILGWNGFFARAEVTF